MVRHMGLQRIIKRVSSEDGADDMSTTAKATVTIEIACTSSWNDAATVAQVKKQAIDDARGFIRKLNQDSNSPLKIVGDIDIKIVTFDA